jgi:hypothetical protein
MVISLIHWRTSSGSGLCELLSPLLVCIDWHVQLVTNGVSGLSSAFKIFSKLVI